MGMEQALSRHYKILQFVDVSQVLTGWAVSIVNIYSQQRLDFPFVSKACTHKFSDNTHILYIYICIYMSEN